MKPVIGPDRGESFRCLQYITAVQKVAAVTGTGGICTRDGSKGLRTASRGVLCNWLHEGVWTGSYPFLDLGHTPEFSPQGRTQRETSRFIKELRVGYMLLGTHPCNPREKNRTEALWERPGGTELPFMLGSTPWRPAVG